MLCVSVWGLTVDEEADGNAPTQLQCRHGFVEVLFLAISAIGRPGKREFQARVDVGQEHLGGAGNSGGKVLVLAEKSVRQSNFAGDL